MERVSDFRSIFKMLKPQHVRQSLGTGEHGVGVGKIEYLAEELGEGTIELMRAVKKAIDPYNLFNPGKVRNNASHEWNRA
jgi:hypothetical protein